MKNENKSKDQIIKELRQRIKELENVERGSKPISRYRGSGVS
jgi:hypothetical protein